MSIRKHKRWARAAALSAIVGLMLNAFMFAWHTPGMSIGGQLAHELGYRTIVICAATGFQTIVVDASGQRVPPPDGDDPAHQQASQACPVCAALAGFVLALPLHGAFEPSMARFQVVAYTAAIDRVRDRRPQVRNGQDPPAISLIQH